MAVKRPRLLRARSGRKTDRASSEDVLTRSYVSAVCLVLEAPAGARLVVAATVLRVGPRFGVITDTVRGSVQAEVAATRRPDTTRSDAAELKALRQEVKDLRRAIDILLAGIGLLRAG